MHRISTKKYNIFFKMQKKRALRISILLSVFCLLSSVGSVWAQTPTIVGNPNNSQSGFRVPGYSLSFRAEYGYNYTWLSHGNFDVQAFMPVNKFLELEGKLQFSTANVYTFGAVARPKIALPVGELFLETELLYAAVARARQHDFCMAASLGYRMDYISFQFGMFSRTMAPFKREWHSEDKLNTEPFNLLYRVEVFCRPQAERWNLMFRASNLDEFRMERMWQPHFEIGGRYDFAEHWRVMADLVIKPTGMFHLNASFYGMDLRGGFAYRF